MPIYEYRCEACGAKFQVVTTISEHGRGQVHCPRCKKNQVHLLFRDVHAHESMRVVREGACPR